MNLAAPVEVVAEGLDFPEGPVVFPDGSVIVVEVHGGRISRCWNGKRETVSECGGGPNGAALGPDGALYVCNNGGMQAGGGGNAVGPGSEGRIERIDLRTGKVERLYEKCDGEAISAPNDLVFDATGGIWFTDLGKFRARSRDHGGLYYCRPDGSSVRQVFYGAVAYNGVGLSPDGESVYVADTYQARVLSFPAQPEAPRRRPTLVATVPGMAGLDSMAITQAGNICVATLWKEAGVSTVTPAGEVRRRPFPDSYTTNIAFGGKDMQDAYVTQSTSGRLLKTRWEEPGLRLNFQA